MSNRRHRTKRTRAPESARDEDEPMEGDAAAMEGREEETPDGDAPGTDGEVEAVDGELTDEIERLQGELGELNDRHLRLAAEFDNFRRRSHSQLGESAARAQAALVAKLLDVLDDFDRVGSIESDQASLESLLEGVRLVERKLHRVLDDAGLEAIDPAGEPFDPNSMEAIMREPAESEDEDDTVGSVLQRGYSFRGHLIRPARVGVRKHDG